MELRLASARFGFSGLRFGGRNFGRLWFRRAALALRARSSLAASASWRIGRGLSKRVRAEHQADAGSEYEDDGCFHFASEVN